MKNGAPSCRMARLFHVWSLILPLPAFGGPLVRLSRQRKRSLRVSGGRGDYPLHAEVITPPGWRAAGSPARPDGAASPSEPPARSGRVRAASR
ncbi:hypothetical protein FZ029_25145 [Azospirillum sp. Sh1]|nr:hypothetical protein FZ029_25145 [Azospirillum sp. Sh1]